MVKNACYLYIIVLILHIMKTKTKKLGIPYMGSKRSKSTWILDTIQELTKDLELNNKFYDLFGGGAAMSFAAQEYGYEVIYNELDKSICELLKLCLSPEPLPSWIYSWVSREEFFKHNKGEDSYAGFIKTCWSFGNSGDAYIYGKHIEDKKKELHNYMVNGVENNLDIKVDMTDDIQTRRLKFIREYKKKIQRPFRMEHLERVAYIEKIKTNNTTDIKVNNSSFEDIEVDNNSIVYLDPPYKNTKKYMNETCHNIIKEYILKSKHLIFVSGYTNDYDLFEVSNKEVTSSMSATQTVKKTERLFCNIDLRLPPTS